MKQWLFISSLILVFGGCASRQPEHQPAVPVPEISKPQPKPPVVTPEKPTKIHKLKEVQDDNFDPEYMYPETAKKKYKAPASAKPADSTPVIASNSMSREECIGMIGQARFDKYTQMLGGESAAIKRCMLLKSMQ